jgi:inosine-uridine nucleoside N-ribohydrolase
MTVKKQRIVLDCDTKNEIDDQFAIAYALASPHVTVEGVVSVQNTGEHGEKSVDLYHAEARKVLRLARADVPALKGSRLALDLTRSPVPSPGVSFIIECAREYRKNVTIVGTGPATDLAAACLLAPSVMKQTKLVWIGGFRTNEEMKRVKARECNFVNDKRAVALLCSMDLDFTMLPAMGVTDRMMMQVHFFAEQLEARGTPLSRYLAQLIGSVPDRFRILWDIAAVAVAEGFGVEKVVRKPACVLQRGKLVYPPRSSRTIKVVDSIDEFAILAEARRRLLR